MFCFGVRSKATRQCRESLENLACLDRDTPISNGGDRVYKPCYTISVLGAQGVGKTALCERVKGEKCDDVYEIIEDVDEDLVTLRILDVTTSFPTRYKQCNLRRPIVESEGYILVYSITDRRSLASIHQMASYIRYVRKNRDLPVVLVGNKMDANLDRCISQEEGRQLAFDLGVSFYETSARLTIAHVTKVFHDLVRQIRCVIVRRELEREQEQCQSQLNVCSPLCGARGLVDRISFRTRNRRKLLLKTTL